MHIKKCKSIYSKLRRDLGSLKLPIESRESLKVVMHFLSTLVDFHKNIGSTTDKFVEMISQRRETVMGPDTWAKVKNRFTKKIPKSIFNFK